MHFTDFNLQCTSYLDWVAPWMPSDSLWAPACNSAGLQRRVYLFGIFFSSKRGVFFHQSSGKSRAGVFLELTGFSASPEWLLTPCYTQQLSSLDVKYPPHFKTLPNFYTFTSLCTVLRFTLKDAFNYPTGFSW